MNPTDLATRAMLRLARGGSASRFGTQVAIDVISWVLAIVLGVLLRYDFAIGRVTWASVVIVTVAATVVQVLGGFPLYLYRGRHPYGSFAELRTLVIVVSGVVVLVGGPVAIWGGDIGLPRSTVFIAAPLALMGMGAARSFKRLLIERSRRPSMSAERTLILGAGYVGAALVRRMLTDAESRYLPVGFIDDNPQRRHSWFDGARVLGTRKDLTAVARQTGATVLVVAVRHADAALLREIADAAVPARLTVRVVSPLEDVLVDRPRLRDLREVTIEDLIGRRPHDTQVESIAGYLEGKRVLVTGAGGSIGMELCRQISRFHPGRLVMLDRDESGLQQAQILVHGHGLLDGEDQVLADIRDADALRPIFDSIRPEVVFHAAALKHLPMLEQFPEEAWKTNVIGTLNVLNESRNVGVETFINISTDKASQPTSVLGHTKRAAEGLTAWVARESGSRYLSVRFGNVLGSRGSMLPTFHTLIEAGGPLTVTHPDATRFFMTIPEACQLVMQAGAIGEPGEVLILDMGEPVRILDVAQRMIEMSGKDIAIVFTGLRPGEKLHEQLVDPGEPSRRPAHPKIAHTTIAPLAPSDLAGLRPTVPEPAAAE